MKRVVIVTNRPEPDLCADLAEQTGMEVSFCTNHPRKLNALTDAIKAGRFAIILLVTSFVHHSDDAKVRRACQGRAVMLRVKKGKLRTLVGALAQHIGGDTA